MTNYFYSIAPHNSNDLGWKQVQGNPYKHWFHSSIVSRIAISHCNMARSKSEFVNLQNNPLCPYCRMIEELRDGLDATQERMVVKNIFNPMPIKPDTTKQHKQKFKKGK